MIQASNRQQRKRTTLARSRARQELIAGTLAPEAAPDQLVRPVYWQRQVVTAEDLTAGQTYLCDLLRQHNRINHGAGVACGLEVLPAPRAATGQPQVTVTAGYAVAPQGDEIYVPDDQTVLIDCVPSLGDECLDPAVGHAEQAVYLVIRYAEAPVCPTPHYAAPCDPLPTCEHRHVQTGFEIGCLSTPPPGLSLACQSLIEELICYGPPGSLDEATLLSLCPGAGASPWVVLAKLYLDANGQLADITYYLRRRLFAVEFLGHLVRCMARLAPISGEIGPRFEVYVDHIGEYRWRLVTGDREIIADSGEGFATREEAIRELEHIKRSASGASVSDLTVLTPAEQPVDHVWGIGPVYRGRLEGIAITTVGQLAATQPAQVAVALDVSEGRATAFVEAAKRLLSG